MRVWQQITTIHKILVINFDSIAECDCFLVYDYLTLMFITSFCLLLVASICGNSQNVSFAANKSCINVLTACMGWLNGTTFILLWMMSAYFDWFSLYNKSTLAFFSDWRVYVAVFIGGAGIYLTRQNYIVNHGNVSAINFSILSSLAVMPALTSFLDPLLGFENTLLISYSNEIEPFILSAVIMLICTLFFAGKKKQSKNGIKSYGLLLALSTSLSLSAYINSKLIQTYQPFMTSAFISLIISIPFVVVALINKETQHFYQIGARKCTLILLSGFVVAPLNIIASAIVAVELSTIYKRVSQVIAGAIIDIKAGRRHILTKRDIFLITSLIVISLYLSLRN